MTTSSPKRFSETTHPYSLLDVKNLNKNFAGFQAIDGVNFHLFSGAVRSEKGGLLIGMHPASFVR